MENKEIRNFGSVELRACGENKESREIEGYALVFNSLSHDLGGFREQIMPEAINDVLERSDCVLVLNHDNSRGILGRSKCGKGSLRLKADEKGLHFETKAPKTALGEEALEYLRRGDATQCSFAFNVAEGGDRWEKKSDGTYLRTITQLDKIYDCSILTCEPAYQGTSCSCRSFEDFKEKEAEELRLAKEAEEKAEQEKREKEEAEKAEAIKKAFDKLKEEYKNYLK